MNDEKRRIEMQEERDDEALRNLMEEDAKAEGHALEEAVKAQSIPEEALDKLDKHVEALLQPPATQQKRLLFRQKVLKAAKRAAGYVLVFLFLASTVVMSVSALRIPVLNFFLDSKGRFSSISFSNESSLSNDTALVEWIIGKNLPNGYNLIKQSIGEDGVIWLWFKNTNGDILQVLVRFPQNALNIDTEDADQIPMEVNGHDAVYLRKKGHRVIWADAEREAIFEVYATNLSENDFWEYIYQLAE